jgi:hypothetical protein
MVVPFLAMELPAVVLAVVLADTIPLLLVELVRPAKDMQEVILLIVTMQEVLAEEVLVESAQTLQAIFLLAMEMVAQD